MLAIDDRSLCSRGGNHDMVTSIIGAFQLPRLTLQIVNPLRWSCKYQRVWKGGVDSVDIAS